MRILRLVWLLTLCIGWCYPYSVRVTWRLGPELARALANPFVAIAELEVDVVLEDLDFAGYDLPIVVKRDVIIQGGGSPHPVLDLNYMADKVQLANGVTLTFLNLTTTRMRAKTIAVTPGLDLLAATPPGAKAIVIMEGGFSITESCFGPENPGTVQVHTFPFRPEEIPGEQLVFRNLPQAGCLNNTAAPLLQRCWQSKGKWEDMALNAFDLLVLDGLTSVEAYAANMRFTNYNIWLRNQFYLCASEISIECILSQGLVPCLSQAMAKLPPAKPLMPHDTAAPASRSDGNAPQPLASVRNEQGSRQPVARSNSEDPVLPAVLGAVGGSLAFATLVVLIVIKRRRCERLPTGLHVTMPEKHRGGGPAVSEAAFGAGSKADAGGGSQGHAVTLLKSSTSPSDVKAAQAGYTHNDAGAPAFPHIVLSLMTPPRPDLNLDVQLVRLSEDGHPGQAPAREDPHKAVLPAANPARPASANSGPGHDPSDEGRDPPSRQEELRLLNVILGRGGSGKVVVGEYRKKKVAVKLLTLVGSDVLRHAQAGLPESPEKSAAEDKAKDLDVAAAVDVIQGGGVVAGGNLWESGVDGWRAAMLKQSFYQEVDILGRCQHPNVVRLLAVCTAGPQLCMVMELAETNLARLLYGSGGHGAHQSTTSPAGWLPLQMVLNIALDIARGLEYLHPTIMHRDLKPANVLIDGAGTGRPMAKLADFGLSRMRTTIYATANPEVGTPPYMAPECFDVDNFVISHHVDLYSLAVLLYEMVSGQQPWPGANAAEIGYNVVVHNRRPPLDAVPRERCPLKLKKLISQCWDQVPLRRPAAAEVVKQLLLVQEGLMTQDAHDLKGAPGQAPSLGM